MTPGEHLNIGWLGFIVFTIVIGSLFFIILSSILSRPWKPKVTLVFIGMIVTLFSSFIGFSWLLGKVMSFLVP